MPNDRTSPSFEELQTRADEAMAISRELIADLHELLVEYHRLHERFVESHRSRTSREDETRG